MTKNGYYDLAKQADYDRFAKDYSPALAKACRFSLAYGVKYTGKQLRATCAAHKLAPHDYAKLEAAFASAGLVKP